MENTITTEFGLFCDEEFKVLFHGYFYRDLQSHDLT